MALEELALTNEMKEKNESILSILKRKHTKEEFMKALELAEESDELEKKIKRMQGQILRAERP